VTHDFPILNDLLVIMIASIPIAFLFSRLRLPVIVGFMMTGILIGPYALGFISEPEAIELLAEIGVVLLLFAIGLEFSLRRIIEMRRLVLWGGGVQVLVTVAAAAGIFSLVGQNLSASIFGGFLIALSSTAIVLKSYNDNGEIDTPHGRAGVGILLFQDLCIVPMMILTPMLSGREGLSAARIAVALGTALGAVAAIVVTSRVVVPYLLHHVVKLRSPEVFVIFVVLAVLGTSWLTAHAGLSLALGAFIAGVVLSESEYSHQIVADILPFRDVFNCIFFVSIGMLLSVGALWEHLPTVAAIVAGLVVGKTLVVVAIVRLLGYSLRIATITGLGVAQIGEFSFILASEGLAQQLLTESGYQLFLASSIISMILTPFLIKAAPAIGFRVQSLFSPDSLLEPSMMGFGDTSAIRDHVIIVGYGLNGRNVAKVLKTIDIAYKILEVNAESVRAAKKAGERISYGDAARREVLHMAGIERARILVIAIADPIASRHIVYTARQMNPKILIIVRTRYMLELEDLQRLGANQVIPEEFETSLEIAARVLGAYGVPRIRIRRRKDMLRREGYSALREPTLPSTELGTLADVLETTTTETVVVDEHSVATGMRIAELDLRRRSGATIIAVNRGDDTEVNPGPEFFLEPGDAVVLLGNPEQIDQAVEILAGGDDARRQTSEARPATGA
jgi:CPA2 family monovalent cation:H+ antiporter-2